MFWQVLTLREGISMEWRFTASLLQQIVYEILNPHQKQGELLTDMQILSNIYWVSVVHKKIKMVFCLTQCNPIETDSSKTQVIISGSRMSSSCLQLLKLLSFKRPICLLSCHISSSPIDCFENLMKMW